MKKPPKSPTIKRNPGTPAHVPTDAIRKTVQLHAMVGTPQETICEVLGICDKTLRHYYRKELDTALAQANATVGGKLYQKATDGDTTAMIFWLKTRARWRETQEIDVKKETTFVFRAPPEAKDHEEWITQYGPKTIEVQPSPPSGLHNPDRKRLS